MRATNARAVIGGAAGSTHAVPFASSLSPRTARPRATSGKVAEGVRKIRVGRPAHGLTSEGACHQHARHAMRTTRPEVVGGAADRDAQTRILARGEKRRGKLLAQAALLALRLLRGGLADRAADRPIHVEVVGDDELRARFGHGRDDGGVQRRELFRPAGVAEAARSGTRPRRRHKRGPPPRAWSNRRRTPRRRRVPARVRPCSPPERVGPVRRAPTRLRSRSRRPRPAPHRFPSRRTSLSRYERKPHPLRPHSPRRTVGAPESPDAPHAERAEVHVRDQSHPRSPLYVLRTDNEPRVRDGYIRLSTRGHARARSTRLGGSICRKNVTANALACPLVPPRNLHREGVDGSSPSEGLRKFPANRHFVTLLLSVR